MAVNATPTSQTTASSEAIKRVGVIGGGQLAWMMADAAKKLELELVIQTPHETDPAVAIATHTILAPITDVIATAQLAGECDVITFENEFVDLEALSQLVQRGARFYPRLDAIAPLLDKYQQRCYLQDLGLPVPSFVMIEAIEQIHKLPLQWGFPLVLKARRHGYDGQGTFLVQNRLELEEILWQWQNPDGSWATQPLLEEFVPFERELAVMVARSVTGEIVTYPVVETQQEDQVCHRVLVLTDLDPQVRAEVEGIARTLVESLQAVGIFGIEFFLTAEGKVLVNEIAPRTHNSGHFTLDACATSQFEQHLRAVAHLPLGDTTLCCAGAVMVNLLGFEQAQNDYLAKRQQLAQIPLSHVHWYGKSESRPGRKLGHVTVLLNTQDPVEQRVEALAIARTVESFWYGDRP